MSSPAATSAFEEALDWAIRIQDPAFADWQAHLDWLNADPSHAALYQRAALLLGDGLADLDRSAASPVGRAANDDAALPEAPMWRRRGGWLAAAAAVAASAAFVMLPSPTPGTSDLRVATAPGETRSISLADGSMIALNGDTAITVSAAGPRRVRLERGEIFVRVVHDANDPFGLRTEQGLFEDVGTAFNARAEQGAVQVSVADGAVAYDPEQANIRIDAGQSLRVTPTGARLSRVSQSAVGSWRLGRLVYADADLRLIAADLSRSLGEDVRVAGRFASRRFTGVIPLDGAHDRIVRRFASLVELSAVRDDRGWRIDAAR